MEKERSNSAFTPFCLVPSPISSSTRMAEYKPRQGEKGEAYTELTTNKEVRMKPYLRAYFYKNDSCRV